MPQPGEARYSDPGWRAELNSGQPGYQAKRRVPRVAANTVFARADYMIAAWLSTWPPGRIRSDHRSAPAFTPGSPRVKPLQRWPPSAA